MKFRSIQNVAPDFITYIEEGEKKYIDLSACRNTFRLTVNNNGKDYPFFAGRTFPDNKDFPYVGMIERTAARTVIQFHNLSRTTFEETGSFLDRIFRPRHSSLTLTAALEAAGWKLLDANAALQTDGDAKKEP